MQVVFDTNAYRQLVRGLDSAEILDMVREMREREAEKGVFAWASSVVLLELFAHLADPGDPHFSECLAAISAGYPHSRGQDGISFRMMQWPFIIIQQTVLGIGDKTMEQQVAGMDQLAGLIAREPTLENADRYKQPLVEFKRYAEGQEEAFMHRFKEGQETFWAGYEGEAGLVKEMRGEDFLNRLAFHELINAALGAKVDLSSMGSADVEKCFRMVKNYFSAPLWLFIEMMSRMVGNKSFNIERGSRRNWYWDYQMLFQVSNHTMFVLVSDDKDIKRAAEAAGAGERVLTLGQYRRFLDAPLSEVMESQVVRVTLPAGQEIDLSDIAKRFGWSETEVEQMKAKVREGSVKIEQSKAAVLMAIQPFYDETVEKSGAGSNKASELIDVGKFIHYNTLKLRLAKVGESPDFIIEYEGEMVGLEHTLLVDQDGQYRVGKMLSFLEEAANHVTAVAPEIVGLYSVDVDTDKIALKGRPFMRLPKLDLRIVARELGDYIIAMTGDSNAVPPPYVESITRYEQATLSLSPTEDFIRRGVDRNALVARIADKEAKVERYKENSGLSACWLLVVYASAVSSGSFHIGLEDLPTDRVVFDRIFLMDSFAGTIIEGRLQR